MWLSIRMNVGWPPGLAETIERRANLGGVVSITHTDHTPAIGEETRLDVLGEGKWWVEPSIDIRLLSYIQQRWSSFEMPGQRGSFARNSFHHAAVTRERVDVVVKNEITGPVEIPSQPFTRPWPCRR